MKQLLYIALFCIICLGCSSEDNHKDNGNGSYTLLDSKTTYVAGETVKMRFEGLQGGQPLLWVRSAFGSALLVPDSDDDLLTFTLPKFLARKSGYCSWELILGQNVQHKGGINILPHPTTPSPIASYLGPRSIVAGGDDYTMLVTLPTDRYDNPLADSTSVIIKQQFAGQMEETTVSLKNGVGWKNFYSPERSGRLLIAASSEKSTSKELTAMVEPAKATGFTIHYQRNHPYADGNQVITFVTDIIKDAYGNSISDGTLVNFLVTNDEGMQLRTMGSTLKGLAKGELLHPDIPTQWTVTAFVTGAARSNTLTMDFEPALSDFKLSISPDGRFVSLFGLHSFMGQLIPDGISVSLEISTASGTPLEVLRTSSRLGTAQFEISRDFYPKGTYMLKVEAAGIRKTKTVTLQ